MEGSTPSGYPSRHLDAIEDAMHRGNRIIHVLYWEVSHDPGDDICNEIRNIIHKLIYDVPQIHTVNDLMGVEIVWVMPNVSNSATYHTNSIYSYRVTIDHVC